MNAKDRTALYLRNIVFGVEDSLVSTVGLLAGLASANTDRAVIILTGVVYILVESLSMAVGSFLSEQSAEEYERKKEIPFRYAFTAAVVMFFSFAFAGLFPVLPYMVLSGMHALYVSVLISLVLLAALGAYNGKIARVSKARSAFRMFILGGSAIILGVVVGQVFGIA